jgi:hypothetical protein
MIFRSLNEFPGLFKQINEFLENKTSQQADFRPTGHGAMGQRATPCCGLKA